MKRIIYSDNPHPMVPRRNTFNLGIGNGILLFSNRFLNIAQNAYYKRRIVIGILFFHFEWLILRKPGDRKWRKSELKSFGDLN